MRHHNRVVRSPVLLIVAALALAAPSCPRDFGPRDFDPDATGRFRPYPADSDLVYVGGLSAKGDSVYVIAMPTGAVAGRIDGPDRRGWAFAGDRAYYTVTRSPDGVATLHRLDLRSGQRTRVAEDRRSGTHVFDPGGPPYSTLALTSEGLLLVARVLRDGPRASLVRYDATTGSLYGERSWPIREDATGVVRAAEIARDMVAVVGFETREGRVSAQQLRVIGSSGREIAAVNLPDGSACSPELVRVGMDAWGTVCSWPSVRYGAALILDREYSVIRSTTLEFERAEMPLTWLGSAGGLSVITDKGRRLVTREDAPVEASSLDQQLAGVRIGAFARVGGGRVVAGWISDPDRPRASGIVAIDVAEGHVTTRAGDAEEQALGFAAAGDRLYALLASSSSRRLLQRFDPVSLVRIGAPVAVPDQDDVQLFGVITVAPP